MPVSFDTLSVGSTYDRPTLAKIWGYQNLAAIAKGVFTPAKESIVVLFVTREREQPMPHYEDTFDGDVLRLEGEERHGSDQRLISSKTNGDEVHLFYKDRHHEPFTYCGEFAIEGHQRPSEGPSMFEFRRTNYTQAI